MPTSRRKSSGNSFPPSDGISHGKTARRSQGGASGPEAPERHFFPRPVRRSGNYSRTQNCRSEDDAVSRAKYECCNLEFCQTPGIARGAMRVATLVRGRHAVHAVMSTTTCWRRERSAANTIRWLSSVSSAPDKMQLGSPVSKARMKDSINPPSPPP